MRRLTSMTREIGLLIVALAVTSAACGTDPVSDNDTDTRVTTAAPPTTVDESTTSPPADTVTSGNLGIVVPPDAEGQLPPGLTIGCWNGPRFEIADLSIIEPLDSADPGGVAEAIAPFLSSAEGAFWPQSGWLVLHHTDQDVLLVHEVADGLAFMTTEFVDGMWQWSGSSSGGPCPLYYQVPEQLDAVDWRLDPNGSPLAADAVEIDVLMTERACVSGQPIGDRLLEPEVVMTSDQVRIALAAEPPPGEFFECPGNPETAFEVALPEPLGDREIIEGLAIGIELEDYLP